MIQAKFIFETDQKQIWSVRVVLESVPSIGHSIVLPETVPDRSFYGPTARVISVEWQLPVMTVPFQAPVNVEICCQCFYAR